MAGQRRVDQAAQAVVQAQGFNLTVYCDLALLQAVEQLYAGGNRLGRPVFQQLGLRGIVGCCEVAGVIGEDGQWQQHQAAEDKTVKGSGHNHGLAQIEAIQHTCGSGLARDSGNAVFQ